MRPLVGKINAVANFFEGVGLLVKTGLVDRDLMLEMWASVVIQSWERLTPVVAIYRRRVGDALWENFEYLTVLARQWIAAHPKGAYPAGVQRIELKDEYLEADKLYAASLAPA
jgi:hypothetical protein